jgi:casein kinase II subunit beta
MFRASGDISTDSEEDYSEISGSELDEEITWIEWFCHLKGNEFFVEVDEDYIQDDFNLTGLSGYVPYYEYALNMILDFDDQDDQLPEDQQPLVETAAQMLYGLIHARFILTSRGMAAMLDKYNSYVYGTCQLSQCEALNQAVLPIGMSDLLQQSAAKVYCPHCREIYFPKSSRLEALDGGYFGTSFAHLFFLTYQHLVPQSMPTPFVPRLYGFKVHKSVKETLRKNQKQLTGWTAADHRGGAQGAAGADGVEVGDTNVRRGEEILAD